MAVSTCPNCHQAVTPGDDICENCGAVLTSTPTLSPSSAAPASSAGQPTTCPYCHQAVAPGDDICENCGAVIATLAIPPVSPPASNGPASVAASSSTRCPHCQHTIPPGDDICENCGAVLATVTSPTTTSPRPSAGSSATLVSGVVACPQCGAPRAGHVKFCNRCGYHYTDPSIVLPPGVTTLPGGPNAELIPGSILHGKYRITRTVGAGGMGAVYLAEDQVLKRNVVIKALLNEDDPSLAAQSIKEREFLATIKHASIVSIYDFIRVGTSGYIVMEYVQGKTLEQIMEERGRPFDVPSAIRYILGILPAFSYLAKLSLVYCDFKPQNVMVEQLKDGSEVVKLIDLGTVIKYEPNPGDVYGTSGFYAREAVKHPSPETDLYSICRTLAYIVTLMDLANPIFGLPDQKAYSVFEEYPPLYRLLAKGTHVDPQRRFHSAEELSEQLSGVLRMVEGGKVGVPVTSTLFVAGTLTTTGSLGLRGEAALDEQDKAIDALRHGDMAMRSGSQINAIGFYKQAQNINARSIDAHLRLAEAYIDMGEHSRAMSEITLAQRLQPGHWKISWYTARLLEAQENYAEAIKQYQELINDLPGELPPQHALARVYAKQGNHHAAINFYAAILKADPGHTEASLGMANSYIAIQQWDEAAKALAGVSEVAAKYVEAQLLLCDIYLNRMKPTAAHHIQNAVQALQGLKDRTEEARFYLTSADAYYAAWRWLRGGAQLSLPGVPVVNSRTMGALAEENYQQYLRRSHNKGANRETVIRRKLEVSPWRIW